MKTAIIGVGRMGRRHIQAARLAGLDVVAVFDVSPDSMALAAQEANVPEGALFADRQALYEAASPECVIVATTADSHCDLVCEAAERGARFILVEKPMAVSISQCDRMIEKCAQYGVKLSVNHQMRYMDQYTVPRALATSEEFGGICSMTVVGGNLGISMNGSHYFEAFRLLAGEDAVEVCAWFSSDKVPNPRGPQFEDRAGSFRATTVSGKRLYMEIGADQGHGFSTIYGCRYGLITVNELTGHLSSAVRESEYRSLPTSRYAMPARNSSSTIKPAEVIDTSAAVLRALVGGDDWVTGEDGRRVVTMLSAAYQSAEQGSRPVRLVDKDLDKNRVFPWA